MSDAFLSVNIKLLFYNWSVKVVRNEIDIFIFIIHIVIFLMVNWNLFVDDEHIQ